MRENLALDATLNPMKQRLQAWGDSKVIEIVGAFVFNDEGEVLLLQRHAEDLGGGLWARHVVICYS